MKNKKFVYKTETKNFKVTPEEVQEDRRNYQLIPDLKEGFSQARRNNQQLLALEYLDKILDIIDNKLSDLDEAINAKDKAVANKPAVTNRAKKTEEPTDDPS